MRKPGDGVKNKQMKRTDKEAEDEIKKRAKDQEEVKEGDQSDESDDVQIDLLMADSFESSSSDQE